MAVEVITSAPQGNFTVVTINSDYLLGIMNLLEAGVGPCCGECFWGNAQELESVFGARYRFQFFSVLESPPNAAAKGMLYIDRIQNVTEHAKMGAKTC